MIDFDMNEKELEKLITILNKYHIPHSIGYLFDDETDDEIGYELFINETSFNVSYGNHDITKSNITDNLYEMKNESKICTKENCYWYDHFNVNICGSCANGKNKNII